MTRSDLRAALAIANVRAFYAVVRHTESSNDDIAYTMVNLAAPDDPARGVKDHHFSSFADHPYAGLKTTQGGYAAGAPQFIPTTWGDLVRQYSFPDFSPPCQDEGYVGRLVYRNALSDIVAGNFEQAVAKCRLEWSSLPGAGESRESWTMEKAKALFRKHGGAIAGEADPRPDIPDVPPAPIPAPDAPPPTREPLMGGLALAGLIGQLLQTVIPVFQPVVRQKVEEAAGKITDAAGANALASGLMSVIQKVTGLADPIQATAAVTAKTPEAQALLAKVEQESLDYLDKLSPWVDKIAAAELANWRANDDSADRASARWANSKHDIAGALVNQANYLFIGALVGVCALVAVQISMSSDGTIDSGTYALLSVLVYGVVRMADRPSAHRFGGAYDSAAVNTGSTVINQTIQERRKP